MTQSNSMMNVLDAALGSATHHAYLFISRSFAADSTPPDLIALLLAKLSGVGLFDGSQKVDDTTFWEAFVRHPDLLRADAQRSILRKEDVELFRERTLYPPTFARRRFLLIERADRMNNQSSNALLKTLEEPLAQCVFVLTTARPQQIPPTITSRCQKITLPSWNSEVESARAQLEPDDARFIDSLFAANHLKTPPVLTPVDSLHSSQKTTLSANKLNELVQWSDSAGRKYTAQLLRDVVVENTSATLKSGMMSQTRATLLMAEINRWADTDPYHPTNSFWLMRILLTLAI